MQENEMCGAFAEILGLSAVDAEDSFFDLGGHSLLASKLVRRIRDRYGVKVPLRQVYQSPTPRALVAGLAG